MDCNLLEKEMLDAVDQRIFPGGVLAVDRGGHTLCEIAAGCLDYGDGAGKVNLDTIYDLASLTKILSTTTLVMILFQNGRIDLNAPLEAYWPGEIPPDKKTLTPRHLLSHCGGFPVWRPFHNTWANLPNTHRRSRALQTILNEPLEYRPGAKAVYSDLDFMLLGFLLEEITGIRQDELFDRYIATPLGLDHIGYRALDRYHFQPAKSIAPTEDLPYRGGVIHGQVHDDNAYALTGVAGHAGLFGALGDVNRLFRDLRNSFQGNSGACLVDRKTVSLFWEKSRTAPGITWALGFDTPNEQGSSAGEYFSRQSVGHLGYTGTSLWYDPEVDLTCILLTNRVHPSAENTAIRAFRPRLHNLVWKWGRGREGGN